MFIPFELNTEENKVIKEIVKHFEASTQKTMRVSKLVKVLRGYICNLPQISLEVLDQLPQWWECSGMDFVEVKYLPRLISGWQPAIEDKSDLKKFKSRI
jgi:hypothetical protein